MKILLNKTSRLCNKNLKFLKDKPMKSVRSEVSKASVYVALMNHYSRSWPQLPCRLGLDSVEDVLDGVAGGGWGRRHDLDQSHHSRYHNITVTGSTLTLLRDCRLLVLHNAIVSH